MTIAVWLVDLVCEKAERVGAARVAEINLRMGVLSGLARSLSFCFPSAARDTLCEGARLNVEEVPLTVHCPACKAAKTPPGLYAFRCPDCGTPTPEVLTGREMTITSIGLVPPDQDWAHRHPGSLPAR